ncbi:MAG: biopolymer transporter ExbD [Deltaproteobacteria bacterium]|nr:biopolymer transporter ExbD [Deltaproteobacteria bacterium]
MTTQSQESSGPTSYAMYDATRKRRKTKRHRRTSEADIAYLNITPMLDMMTILLVFLLKSFSASSQDVSVENLLLPHSTTKLNIDEALMVMITRDKILVDKRLVTELTPEGLLRPEDLPEGPHGYLVEPLYEILENKAAYFKRIEDFGGTQFVGKIAIVADRQTSYQTIFKVLYTAGRAEFGFFKLFVQKPPG